MRASNPAWLLPGVLLPFVATVIAFAVVLRLLNAVPGYWEMLTAEPATPPPALTERLQYASIEALEEDLGVTVLLPRYFPSYLVWPAASIRGQRDPVRVASATFRSRDGEQALQIRQIFTGGEPLPFDVPEPFLVRDRQRVSVGEASGLLLVGESQAGTPVNQLRWMGGGVHFVVTMVYPPEELLRLSRSIHAEGIPDQAR